MLLNLVKPAKYLLVRKALNFASIHNECNDFRNWVFINEVNFRECGRVLSNYKFK